MKVYTEVGHYKATPEVLFDLLSNPENLPKWAITFCKGIEKQEDGYYLVTAPSDDKLFFRIEADKNTGTIDMYVGGTKDAMWNYPSRVTDDNLGGSVFTFTLIQNPEQTDEDIEAQRQGSQTELKHIHTLVE
jgi:hypothetical protein